jgi:hypothetical protein
MQRKETTKLFRGKYQHKVVLVCAGASVFRGADIDSVISKLDKVDLTANNNNRRYRVVYIRFPEELKYAYDLAFALKKVSDLVEIRVESPWISIYTNDESIVDTLINLDKNNVKYVSSPAKGTNLSVGTVIMSKCEHDYRITLGKTYHENSSFVVWAESQADKVRLTKRCRRSLLDPKSSGGTYFYLTGDNVLLMAKVHLGSTIAKVERITKK